LIIFPAIDIKGGNCVRLVKGDFNTTHTVAESYIGTAKSFIKAGAEWIHMVDLDGAKTGEVTNAEIFKEVAALGLKVELGGGIRSLNVIEMYLNAGISRVILGSIAAENFDFVKDSVRLYGDKIAVGIDAKERNVATNGWVNTTNLDFIDFAKAVEQAGVSTIIFTDIEKDGCLTRPNFTRLTEISNAISCDIIASGGVRDVDDIKQLKSMNLYGAIAGKSLYEGTLSLKKAVEVAK